jgi:hypothetical protein
MSPPVTNAQVLDLFAIAYRESTEALADFVARYPERADELVDYAHEINLQRECAGEMSITPGEEIWIEEQVAKMSAVRSAIIDPFAAWQPSQYVEARKSLGVPTAVLTAFRDRLVALPSVPFAFLEDLADLLKVKMSELAAFLEAPPRLANNIAYKADSAPGMSTDKITFEAVLTQAGVSAEKAAALLERDD